MPHVDVNVVIAAGLLAAFGTAGTSLVAFTHQVTAERIATNQREAVLRKIDEILPHAATDNDLLADRLTVKDPGHLGAAQTTLYLGRRKGAPSAIVFSGVEANGYAGKIHLLIGVMRDGSLSGVRVLSHHETPGLGDRIDENRSDWILQFKGRSLGNPNLARWKVRRDGGVFDQFTGATVTPRAVVRAIKLTLEYTHDHWHELFAKLDKSRGTG